MAKKDIFIWRTADGRRCYLQVPHGLSWWSFQWKDTEGHRIPKGTMMSGYIKRIQ